MEAELAVSQTWIEGGGHPVVIGDRGILKKFSKPVTRIRRRCWIGRESPARIISVVLAILNGLVDTVIADVFDAQHAVLPQALLNLQAPLLVLRHVGEPIRACVVGCNEGALQPRRQAIHDLLFREVLGIARNERLVKGLRSTKLVEAAAESAHRLTGNTCQSFPTMEPVGDR